MPYCPNTKLFFIHIPKTGGSSIERVLNCSLMLRKEGPWHYGTSPQHLPLSIIEHEMPNFNECIFFTLVRNPYKRILSEFLWRCKLNKVSYDNDDDIKKAFLNFLTYTLYELKEEERIIAFDRHLETQYSFIQHSTATVNIFKLEKINLLELWLSKIFKKKVNIPHTHKTKTSKNYDFLLADITIKKTITKFYKKDFIFFDYEEH